MIHQSTEIVFARERYIHALHAGNGNRQPYLLAYLPHSEENAMEAEYFSVLVPEIMSKKDESKRTSLLLDVVQDTCKIDLLGLLCPL